MSLEEAKKLTNINEGTVLLCQNGKLSEIDLLKNKYNLKINRDDYIYKILAKGKIAYLTKKELKKIDCLKNIKTGIALLMPLSYHTEPLGIIILLSQKPQSFSKKNLSLLQLYIATSGIIIKKNQLGLQIQNALDTRDRFISIASHALRTPLTSINGYVQLLHKKLSQKKTSEARWIEELHAETNRMTNLIKELLDINRIKQGQLDFELNEVNLVEIIQKAISRFKFIRTTRQIQFTQETNTWDSSIIGDYNKLLQMITALLSNADKFSKPSSKIEITLKNNNKYLNLVFKDHGRGIPKKEINNIFNGFYKIGKDEQGGMGVGLLLTEHIIRHHRGKIKINSTENKGTRIEIRLPRPRTY
jgi:signal transduction histidine kinase